MIFIRFYSIWQQFPLRFVFFIGVPLISTLNLCLVFLSASVFCHDNAAHPLCSCVCVLRTDRDHTIRLKAGVGGLMAWRCEGGCFLLITHFRLILPGQWEFSWRPVNNFKEPFLSSLGDTSCPHPHLTPVFPPPLCCGGFGRVSSHLSSPEGLLPHSLPRYLPHQRISLQAMTPAPPRPSQPVPTITFK